MKVHLIKAGWEANLRMKGGFCKLFSESTLIPSKIQCDTEHVTDLTCGNSSEIIQGISLSTLICNLLFIDRVQIDLIVYILTYPSLRAQGPKKERRFCGISGTCHEWQFHFLSKSYLKANTAICQSLVLSKLLVILLQREETPMVKILSPNIAFPHHKGSNGQKFLSAVNIWSGFFLSRPFNPYTDGQMPHSISWTLPCLTAEHRTISIVSLYIFSIFSGCQIFFFSVCLWL